MTSVAPAPSSDKGKLAVDEKLLQSIQQNTAALLQPQITITLYIPAASVGAVIGRKGQNVANLQKLAATHATTGQAVRVSIVAPHDPPEAVPYTYTPLDFASTSWNPVVIRADPSAALAAAQHLALSLPTIDAVILDVPLSRHKHAAIVGKKGSVLATLSAETNVRIMVPSKDLKHDMVQLEGDWNNVVLCLSKLLALVVASNNTPTQAHIETLTLSVLPSQSKLRNVSRKTECSIKKKKTQDHTWQLTVSGATPQAVQAALASLQKTKGSPQKKSEEEKA